MKEIVGAISGIVAFGIFTTCIIQHVSVEAIFLRTIAAFIMCYIFTYISFALFFITMKDYKEEKNLHKGKKTIKAKSKNADAQNSEKPAAAA